MLNLPHLGELIRESMDEVGWNVTETVALLSCERSTLSRLLNGKAGVSANMAGGHRLGQHRPLDAGELRACAGATRPDGCGTAHEGAACMIKDRGVGAFDSD